MGRGRSAAERVPSLDGHRGRSAEGCRNDRKNEPPYLRSTPRYNGSRAERPPLWGSDDVSAMRNYRYRHRDSPYVAKRSGERTSRAGRPWAVGGNFPERGGAEGLCARCGRPCKGQRRHKRARVGFFHPHPPSVAAQSTAAGRKGGPISSASGYFSSLCWSWGRRTRRRRREAARARRGERHRPCGAARRAVRRGAKRIAQLWTTIGAAEPPFAPPWASALSERPFRPRRKPRAPVRMWPQRPG